MVHTVERDCGDRNTSVDELSLEAEQPRDNLAGPCITACTAQILRHATGKKNACVRAKVETCQERQGSPDY